MATPGVVEEQFARPLRVPLTKQGIVREPLLVCLELHGFRADLRWVVDAYVVAKRDRTVFERPPCEVGVLPEGEGMVESQVEAVQRLEQLAAKEQIGCAERQPLPANVAEGME